MDKHISEKIIEYNFKEEALKDTYISQHISNCNYCKELFERYFNSLEVLRKGVGIPTLSSSDTEKIFTVVNRAKLPIIKSKRWLKIAAIAAAVLIIVLSTIYFINDNFGYRKAELNNLTGILSLANKEEIEMISDMEIYSNLEIIEHLDELELLKEVLGDAI